ncbi:MAG: acyl-CoA dehydrogenase family protein [bacterium]|nr:acyl-CoA dehydrogenase family protein [bacterium]
MIFNSEQKLVQDMVRKFATNELAPIALDLDKKAEFPGKIIQKLAELGLSGIIIPDKYNGSALDMVSYCIVIEELSKVCASLSFSLIVNNSFVAFPIIKYGTEVQKNRWLPKIANGECIGAFALYEETYSNIYEEINADISKKITTIAKPTGNGKYLISGEKVFVVNGETAGIFIAFALLDNKLTAFILPKEGNESNLSFEKEVMMGMRSAGIGSIKLNNVEVSEENILGESGKGMEIFEQIVESANIAISAQAVGIMNASLEDSIKYSKERKQFGHPISEFQLIQDAIAEIKIRLDSSRILVFEAARMYDEGQPFSTTASITKLVATESAVWSSIKTVQVHAGYGYTKEYPIERYFRDAKVTQVFGETPLTQKIKLAKSVLS